MNRQPILTALCSFGMSGRVFHAPFLHVHPGFRLQAVWERSKQKASSWYPEITSYQQWADLLADRNIELVIVNTPNFTHFQLAHEALRAGKHVIVEKPFCVSSNEAAELIHLAQSNNLKLSVYHNRRWDSDFQAVKKVHDTGMLGTLAEAEIHFDRFNLSLSAKEHKEIPGPGTGSLYDLGSHLIDQALVLFGRPEELMADLAIMRPHSRVSDYFEILLRYGQLRVRLKSGYLVKYPVPAYQLHGSGGSLLKSRADPQEEDLQAGKSPGKDGWGREKNGEEGILVTDRGGTTLTESIISPPGNYLAYYDQMYRAIRENTPVPVSAADGRQVIQIIEAAMESDRLRAWVKL